MQNRFSISPLIKGVIEEIDIHKISLCNYKFHDPGSGHGNTYIHCIVFSCMSNTLNDKINKIGVFGT